MNTSRQWIRTQTQNESLLDAVFIAVIALIGLAVLVLANPAFGTDVSAFLPR
jgi:hypothetical protein